jgi:hypothetical protein
VLKSCGYARISGVKAEEFNQNALVVHQDNNGLDSGLALRKHAFYTFFIDPHPSDRSGITDIRGHCYGYSSNAAPDSRDFVMMSMKNPASGSEWFGLGTLTQCIHPIEKCVLEQGFGFSFGWGDNVERYFAVDDGFLVSGTGRFSGVLTAE